MARDRLLSRRGNPVTDVDFWPRPDIVDGLVSDLIEDRGSRCLFALRRIGKTSVLLEVERRLRAYPGLMVVNIDAQGIGRFKDFLGKLFEQLPTEGRFQTARQRIAANSALQSIIPAAWARITGTAANPPTTGILNEFDHSAAWSGDIEHALTEAGPIVLLIDELPFMLRNMLKHDYRARDAERFLATLRSWRIGCGVRMLLSGSIGFSQLNRIDGVQVADHVGDVVPVQLPPLGDVDAVDMVDALALGQEVQGWTRALSRAVVEASAETWPIFLQYGFDAVAKTSERDPVRVPAIVDEGVRQALVETFYKQFTTRLARYGQGEKAARAVLKTVVATAPAATPFSALDAMLDKIGALDDRDDLFEALREDDFVQFDTESQTMTPASKLVPVWVRARAWGR